MSASRYQKPRLISLVLPISSVFVLRIFSYFPDQLEQIYGQGIYPHWASFLRTVTGILSLSFGDILYAFMVIGLLRWIVRIRNRPVNITSAFSTLCWIYVMFQLSWGLNYSRPTADRRLGIQASPSDTAYLHALTDRLLERTNAYAAVRHLADPPPFDRLVSAAERGYAVLSGNGYWPAPASVSVKKSLFGGIGNYIGYSGYFNPFTGEAQLNQAVPSVLHPFVIAHEMGHQLGFAREQEANLTGFLAARASDDSLMRYSAYFDMFLYANAALYRSDSVVARRNLKQLVPAARKDLEALRSFRERYRTWIEDLTDWWYNHYLKMNGQEEGARSYGLVVQTLLALFKRDGDI